MRGKGVDVRIVIVAILPLLKFTKAASHIRAGNNTFFVDDTGRVVALRGLNVAGRAKTPNFTPFYDLEELSSLASFGTNVARLPFIWEAYEPNRGSFNKTYFNYYRSVVEYLYTLGILSIVDVHQDGFSRYLVGGCGDGFPRWTIPRRYNSAQETPDNGLDCKNWRVNLVFDNAVSGSWQAFYNNEGGVRDAFLQLWDTLSATFANNPAILGYDILNEPYGQERRQVQPLWEDAATVIRKNDPDAILFLTPIFLLGLGGQSAIQKPTFSNYAIGVHWYPQGSMTGVSTEDAFNMWFSLVYPWGAPIFVGEFGAEPKCPEPGPNVTTVPALMDGMYNFWDKYLLSWTQWVWSNSWDITDFDGWNGEDYSVVNDFLLIRDNYMIRPYPRAIGGIPLLFKVEQRQRVLQLAWNVTADNFAAGASSRTIIYAPARQFFRSHHG
eukprot:jgi/Botrbrau1/2304/Bobra.101_2s0125.1